MMKNVPLRDTLSKNRSVMEIGNQGDRSLVTIPIAGDIESLYSYFVMNSIDRISFNIKKNFPGREDNLNFVKPVHPIITSSFRCTSRRENGGPEFIPGKK
jgi:hypothetical protein